MDDLQVFRSSEFGEVRWVNIEGKDYSVGIDIARALGYKNPNDAITRHCRGYVKHAVPTTSGIQKMNVLPEGDIYRLAAKSELPEAPKFESWIFDEVLPAIRKHGAYMTETMIEKALTNPDFLIQLATNLKQEQEARLAAESQIAKNRPKVLFAEALEVSDSSCLIGDLAKILRQNGIDIGQNRLFEKLRKEGYLLSRKGESYNMPSQRGLDLELFEIKTRTINNPDGSVRTTRTPKVTVKGQIYFINKYKSELGA